MMVVCSGVQQSKLVDSNTVMIWLLQLQLLNDDNGHCNGGEIGLGVVLQFVPESRCFVSVEWAERKDLGCSRASGVCMMVRYRYDDCSYKGGVLGVFRAGMYGVGGWR